MTAENVGTNAAIGQSIGMSPDIEFDYTTQVHGCVAHVINLAAKEGLKVFGEVVDSGEAKFPSSVMAVHNLVDPPNVSQVNLKTIYNRCHGLVKTTRSSPQRAQAFSQVVKMIRDLDDVPDPSNNSFAFNPTSPPVNTADVDEAIMYMSQDPPDKDCQPTQSKT